MDYIEFMDYINRVSNNISDKIMSSKELLNIKNKVNQTYHYIENNGGPEIYDRVASLLSRVNDYLEEYVADAEKTASSSKNNTANSESPEFIKGDWITDGTVTFHISDVKDGRYYYDDVFDEKGRYWFDEQKFRDMQDKWSLSFDDARKDHMHLWENSDARRGDILCTYECDEPKIVFILSNESIPTHYACSYYCFYNLKAHHFQTSEIKGCISSSDIRPATREQKDKLFKALNAAAYNWNAEKMELIPTKKNPVIKTEACDCKVTNDIPGYFRVEKLESESEKQESVKDNDEQSFNALPNVVTKLMTQYMPAENDLSELGQLDYRICTEFIDGVLAKYYTKRYCSGLQMKTEVFTLRFAENASETAYNILKKYEDVLKAILRSHIQCEKMSINYYSDKTLIVNWESIKNNL